jgi:hypothetical protein
LIPRQGALNRASGMMPLKLLATSCASRRSQRLRQLVAKAERENAQ